LLDLVYCHFVSYIVENASLVFTTFLYVMALKMVFYSSWSVFTVVGFVIFLHSTYVKTKFRQAPHHPSFAGLLHFVLPAYITFAIWDFDCEVVRYLEHCIAPVQVKFGSCLQVCCPSSSRYVGAGCVCVCGL